MENPIKMDYLGGNTPIFGNTHVCFLKFTPSRRAKNLDPVFFLGAKKEVVERVLLNTVKKPSRLSILKVQEK